MKTRSGVGCFWIISTRCSCPLFQELHVETSNLSRVVRNSLQGMDATTVFQDIGHSTEAKKTLSKYFIGELRKVSARALQNVTLVWTPLGVARFICATIAFIYLPGKSCISHKTTLNPPPPSLPPILSWEKLVIIINVFVVSLCKHVIGLSALKDCTHKR